MSWCRNTHQETLAVPPPAARKTVHDPIDLAIEAALDQAMGKSFFCKPTVAAPTLGVSASTFYRGVNTKVIPVVEHMDGIAVIRPVMHRLMRDGVPNMTGKPPLLQLRPANSRKTKAEPVQSSPVAVHRREAVRQRKKESEPVLEP
jgi:hypothetical protein